MKLTELDTPALVVDLDVMERNLRRVADYACSHGLRLRPHTKTHKTPALARRQMELGAAGITVAKVSEAEVMLAAEPADLLIAYPVIGRAKLARLVEVARATRLTVALDSECAARELSLAASDAGVEVGVLAEFDAGLHRVGVRPGRELVALARTIDGLPGLGFRGVAFYPGHIKNDAASAVEGLSRMVSAAVADVETAGLAVEIVSGGSTPALYYSHQVERLNEIRPGTYIFNDRNTWQLGGCGVEDCAAFVLATVVSTAVPGQRIIDGGSKTFSSDRCASGAEGFGYFPEAPGAVLEKMNEEHGFVSGLDAFGLGDKVRVIPNHICVAVNLHERVYGVRGDEVVEPWTVAARGKLQ